MKADTIDVVERLDKLAHRFLNESEGEYVAQTILSAKYRIQEDADTIERLRAELAAKVPEGYVVVPVEPTYNMLDAGDAEMRDPSGLKRAYTAMIAAAEGK